MQKASNRQSMPPQRVTSPPASSFVNQTQYQHQPPSAQIQPIEPTPEEDENVARGQDQETDEEDAEQQGRTRKGTMSKNFKFPSPVNSAVPPVPDLPSTKARTLGHSSSDTEEAALSPTGTTAPTVEVPAPPPVDKERSPGGVDTYEDVGETEEIELN